MSPSIVVVGDLSFEGPEADRPAPSFFSALRGPIGEADLAVGNLECVLTTDGNAIPGKCTLRGAPGWAAVLRDAGIQVVTLANNHAMDYGADGLFRTMDALWEADIAFVGAGANREEALAPLFLTVKDRRVALLARTGVPVTAPVFAGQETAGVAWLDADETVRAVLECRSRADVVMLLVHWGVEEYEYPSPSQRRLARRFVEAGADAVVGHHPHVIQGLERIGNAIVAYSLGNLAFSEFEWQSGPDAVTQLARLSEGNREGMVLRLSWPGDRGPAASIAHTRIASDSRIGLDPSPARPEVVSRLSAALGRRSYPLLWWAYAVRREWLLRLEGAPSPSYVLRNLYKLRFRHFAEFLRSLWRSTKIVFQRSTNPYD